MDLLLCEGSRIVCVLEIKSSQNIAGQQLGGLKSFILDNPGIPAYVLGDRQNRRRLHDDITVINWDEFILEELADKTMEAYQRRADDFGREVEI